MTRSLLNTFIDLHSTIEDDLTIISDERYDMHIGCRVASCELRDDTCSQGIFSGTYQCIANIRHCMFAMCDNVDIVVVTQEKCPIDRALRSSRHQNFPVYSTSNGLIDDSNWIITFDRDIDVRVLIDVIESASGYFHKVFTHRSAPCRR